MLQSQIVQKATMQNEEIGTRPEHIPNVFVYSSVQHQIMSYSHLHHNFLYENIILFHLCITQNKNFVDYPQKALKISTPKIYNHQENSAIINR
jgi:hypothetical protein